MNTKQQKKKVGRPMKREGDPTVGVSLSISTSVMKMIDEESTRENESYSSIVDRLLRSAFSKLNRDRARRR